MRFPAAAPVSHKPRTSLCSRVSKTQLAWGSTGAACHFQWGRGRQAMHLSCKQAHAGALPADSTRFLQAGLEQTSAGLISRLTIGAIPITCTHFHGS